MTVSSAARDSAVSGGAGLRAWIAIGILLLLTLSSNIDRMIIGMLVEPIKADLGLDDVQFSLLHGLAFAVFFAVSSVPMGWAADRFSRRWILFLGAAGWSLCTAACGLDPTSMSCRRQHAPATWHKGTSTPRTADTTRNRQHRP